MNISLNIEDNQKIILSANTGKALLQDEPVLFDGKAKNFAKAIKKSPDGQYWLSIRNIEETQELLFVIKIKKKKVELSWPKQSQI